MTDQIEKIDELRAQRIDEMVRASGLRTGVIAVLLNKKDSDIRVTATDISTIRRRSGFVREKKIVYLETFLRSFLASPTTYSADIVVINNIIAKGIFKTSMTIEEARAEYQRINNINPVVKLFEDSKAITMAVSPATNEYKGMEIEEIEEKTEDSVCDHNDLDACAEIETPQAKDFLPKMFAEAASKMLSSQEYEIKMMRRSLDIQELQLNKLRGIFKSILVHIKEGD